MASIDADLLRSIVGSKPQTHLVPREFFVSWNGVLTLAYRGFSPSLLQIKAGLEEAVPGLKLENPGAKWPKTTLGVLAEGRNLTLRELTLLRDICDASKRRIETSATTLEISRLTLVVFECRSLEHRLLNGVLPMKSASEPASAHAPPLEHSQAVDGVMAQFSRENLAAYLKDVQAPGNREPHYRDRHVEATLVCDWAGWNPAFVSEFKTAVDEALPFTYAWFQPSSLHLTVRGLA